MVGYAGYENFVIIYDIKNKIREFLEIDSVGVLSDFSPCPRVNGKNPANVYKLFVETISKSGKLIIIVCNCFVQFLICRGYEYNVHLPYFSRISASFMPFTFPDL